MGLDARGRPALDRVENPETTQPRGHNRRDGRPGNDPRGSRENFRRRCGRPSCRGPTRRRPGPEAATASSPNTGGPSTSSSGRRGAPPSRTPRTHPGILQLPSSKAACSRNTAMRKAASAAFSKECFAASSPSAARRGRAEARGRTDLRLARRRRARDRRGCRADAGRALRPPVGARRAHGEPGRAPHRLPAEGKGDCLRVYEAYELAPPRRGSATIGRPRAGPHGAPGEEPPRYGPGTSGADRPRTRGPGVTSPRELADEMNELFSG